MDMPKKREVTVTRHEWTVARTDGHPITARAITDAIGVATRAMRDDLNIDTSYDDSWFIRPEDDDIVIFVEVEA